MDSRIDPLQQMAENALRQREQQAHRRTADEVIASDDTLRPFSTRLTAKEIVRLRSLARAEGMTPSDLLRQILNDGLNHLEQERQIALDPQQALKAIRRIKQVVDDLGLRPQRAKKRRSAG